MTEPVQRTTRRSLFWRLWLRALTVKRPQATLATVSLLVGASVVSVLLNIYVDARRKMTQEFRAYGANVVLAAAAGTADSAPTEGATNAGLMDEAVLTRLAEIRQRSSTFTDVPVLYAVTRLERAAAANDSLTYRLPEFANVVAVGADIAALRKMNPGWRVSAGADSANLAGAACTIGADLARKLHLGAGDSIRLQALGRQSDARSSRASSGVFRIASVLSTGAAEDDQVFVPLSSLQILADFGGKISLVELSVPGESAEVEEAVRALSGALPGLEVRPIRQIVYSEGRVLNTLRWLMFALTSLILVIIALCVMATMMSIVLERRKDIAVMKALGASDRLVMKLFVSEGAGLGLVGGAIGYLIGALVARDLGQRLFGVRLDLTWWTLPVICGVSVGLAIVATLVPVRIVRGVQPAAVLRGE